LLFGKDFHSDGSGSKTLTGLGQFFVSRVGSGLVSHLWFGFGYGKFPLKISNFSPLDQKNLFGSDQKVPGSKAGWPLIYCGSKVCLGRVGLGQGPSLIFSKIQFYDSKDKVRRIYLF